MALMTLAAAALFHKKIVVVAAAAAVVAADAKNENADGCAFDALVLLLPTN